MIGGWVADTYWGRFKCIQVAIGIATVGHIVIVISALPPVLENTSAAMGVFCLGLVIFGVGVGFFKCNISPLIAEQYQKDNPRATVFVTKTGERVIHDPQMTLSRIYIRYYFFINVGALVGQITMVYAEKYVGFWLAFLLPTIMFLFCPVVMILCRNRYVRIPPTGSVLTKAARLIAFAMKRSKTANIFRLRDQDLWDSVKPSHLSAEERPAWMTFDDAWVDQVRRGLSACAVFIFLPIYWLSYNQMTSNLVTQAGTMALHGLPNDIVNNIDPIALLILIPIFDKLIYPSLARASIRFTPIKKIAAGLGLGCLSMVTAAVIQHYIYMKAPCGDNATDGDCIAELGPPNLNVWIQTPAYVLIAVAETFASVTTLEYAYTKAPSNMRSFVTGLYWFTNAFSAALGQAFVPLSVDPLFTWNYTVIACISFVAMVLFWVFFRKLDQEEDMLNALPDTTFKGRKNSVVDLEAVQQEQARQEKLRRAQGLDHAKGAQ
jgi:POT family proton-dependent oligopeptide transporter